MMKDEIRAQKERVKQMSRRERFKYFWYYQWKWVALAVAVIAFLCYLGFTIYKNSFEEYVYVALVNCDITKSQQSQELMEGYAASRNVDTSQTPVSINTKLSIPEEATGALSVANSQTLQAYIETGDYDVLIGNTWIIDGFASQGYLCDLKAQLPADLYEKVKDRLYEFTYDNGETYAIGFYSDDLPAITSLYTEDSRPIIALPASSKSLDVGIDFIRYLYELADNKTES